MSISKISYENLDIDKVEDCGISHESLYRMLDLFQLDRNDNYAHIEDSREDVLEVLDYSSGCFSDDEIEEFIRFIEKNDLYGNDVCFSY